MKRLEEWIDKHINPIVLQESRYILSLRRSIIIYLLLVLIMSISSCSLMEGDSEESIVVLLGAFSIVATVVVPGHILFSSSERWSREKMEMLQLTPLTPLQIVMGRVMAAFVLVLAILSVALPFLAVSYLVPGTELSVVLLSVILILGGSLLSITASINVAWLLEGYSVQSLGKIFWLLMLFQYSFGIVTIPVLLNDISNDAKVPPSVIGLWILIGMLLTSLFFLARSVVHLRHPEENRSTPIRVSLSLCFLFLVFSLLLLAVIDPSQASSELGIFLLSLIAFFSLGFLIEPDAVDHQVASGYSFNTIGRRALLDLPRSRSRRLLLLPLLPSSGTGVMLFALLLGTLGLSCEILNWRIGGYRAGGYAFYAMWLFCVFGSALPVFRNLPGVQRDKVRRIVILIYLAGLLFVLFMLNVMFDFQSSDHNLLHYLLNPFKGISAMQDRTDQWYALFIVTTIFSVLVFALHSQMIWQSISTILKFETAPVKRVNK